MSRYKTVGEAAVYLNVTVRFVRRLIAERRIRFYRMGRHIRIAVSDLDDYVNSGCVEAFDPRAVRQHVRRGA